MHLRTSCPHYRAELEARFNDWQGWLRCPACGLDRLVIDPGVWSRGKVSLGACLPCVLAEMEKRALVVAGFHLATGCAVQVEDVVKRFGPASSSVFALQGVSLEIRRGERVALLGKSGSGKSTLLNLIGGLDRPTSGCIRAGDRDLARLTADELAAYRLSTAGMIFQAYNLVPSRTALENVELPMILAGRPAGKRRAAARQALAAVGLGERFQHRPPELSGGEHQRVAIARALVNRPKILLADEPTGNLDSATATEIMALLLDHVRRDGTTLIMVTHDEELARQTADRIVRLKDGQVLE